ncbi:hypothetical protein SAMN05444166_4217 [Singulisphaera sp. GP187]|nr:hypothetical protein SAMN05444166_4217 [Singulisphaera sp. GP187]
MKPQDNKTPDANPGVGGKGSNKRKPPRRTVREWRGPSQERCDRRWNGEPMRGYTGSSSNDE